jgi:hypothetical protein
MAETSGRTGATPEEHRLQEAHAGVPWRTWGPYLSERRWRTAREDYSESGDAWPCFTRDQARSRAYRWGETGWTGLVARLIKSLGRFTLVEVFAENCWRLARPYRRLEIPPTAEPASVG